MREEVRRGLQDAPLPRLLTIAGHLAARRWSTVTDQPDGFTAGLTAAGVGVLLALTPNGVAGRARHTELARRLWIRPATLTGVVYTLQRAGLVARVRDGSDRRAVWISLTEAGAERAGRLQERLDGAFPPTGTERDPVKAAAVREYLIEVIAACHEEGR